MEQLREAEKFSYAPILVLTTQSDQNIQFNALAAEARDLVEKPFDINGVVPRISNMLETRLLNNQVRDQNQILEKKVTARTREYSQSVSP
jgi:putative two-component system response regulator